MLFDEEFIKSLPDSPYPALKAICKRAIPFFRKSPRHGEIYELVVEAFAFTEAYIQANDLDIPVHPVPGANQDFQNMAIAYFQELQTSAEQQIGEVSFQDYKSKFGAQLGTVFHYEFSDGDLQRIQELINQLRELISGSEQLEENHKQRLLSRLEKLQSELHKKVSDLDRFWGSLLEASIVLGQLGENVKPMVNVIHKIVGIIWPAQARAFELPSDLPFKLLGPSQDDKDDKSEDSKTEKEKS